MVNKIQRFKILMGCSTLCVALTACGPKYVPAESLGYNTGYSQGAYSPGAYGQESYAQDAYFQGAYTHGQTQQSSRYGQQAGLRGPCAPDVYAPCGYMRVVPVYPVYQYVIPTEPEPVAEVPTISLPADPEPVIIYEPEVIPEPAYTPAPYHWPEPAAEVPSWKPLRK